MVLPDFSHSTKYLHLQQTDTNRGKGKGYQENHLAGAGRGEPVENEVLRGRTMRFSPSQELSLAAYSDVPSAHQSDIVNPAPTLSLCSLGKFYSAGASP